MAAEARSRLTQAGVCGGTCGVLLASLWFDWALGMGYVYLAQQALYACSRSQSQHSQLIEAKGMQKRWKQAVLTSMGLDILLISTHPNLYSCEKN